ncbi:MAG: antibiotic biosynthesis monooxygenase [Candidatus Acidiferrum sp.]
MFLILWEFDVKPGEELPFEKAYGPLGPWVGLFQRDRHFRQTQLLKDPSRSGVYFTLDFWDSEDDYKRFKHANQGDYESIDRMTQGLTIRERNLGCFLQLGRELASS